MDRNAAKALRKLLEKREREFEKASRRKYAADKKALLAKQNFDRANDAVNNCMDLARKKMNTEEYYNWLLG